MISGYYGYFYDETKKYILFYRGTQVNGSCVRMEWETDHL